MGIEIIGSGDMRDDPADLLVCCVNLRPGVMGAGQAKAFADRWPDLVESHRFASITGKIAIGRGCISWRPRPITHRSPSGTVGIFLLPTRDDWRDPSRLSWVHGGLESLRDCVEEARMPGSLSGPIDSVAIPAVGCGPGGLAWADVRPLIEDMAGRLPDVAWRVYEPGAERRARA